MVKWETASEQNNTGFNVQRKADNGDWQTIAFIPSAANGGNNSAELSYQYKDVNNAKGISQYRIQQINWNGQSQWSDVRSVRGAEQTNKVIVYPNPSVNGKINILFDEASAAKNVMVSDMAGRVIKSYRNVTSSNLTIDNLEAGMYSIQVTELSTNATTLEKVVIRK